MNQFKFDCNFSQGYELSKHRNQAIDCKMYYFHAFIYSERYFHPFSLKFLSRFFALFYAFSSKELNVGLNVTIRTIFLTMLLINFFLLFPKRTHSVK